MRIRITISNKDVEDNNDGMTINADAWGDDLRSDTIREAMKTWTLAPGDVIKIKEVS